jgi:magnesium transporter
MPSDTAGSCCRRAGRCQRWPAEQEDLVGQVRLCLVDGQRDLKSLYRQRCFLQAQREWIAKMLGDVETLLPHNAFLSEKADFLLNTAQGFLNTEQSQILKIFSIVALVFLPPTLVATSYGMIPGCCQNSTGCWATPSRSG